MRRIWIIPALLGLVATIAIGMSLSEWMIDRATDPDKYPDRLWPRLGRGQWVGKPWSVEVVKFVDPIPEQWR